MKVIWQSDMRDTFEEERVQCDNEQEARDYAANYLSRWGWGYGPTADVRQSDGVWYVTTKRYKSCD